MDNLLTNLTITGINGRMGRQLLLSSYMYKLSTISLAIVNNNLKTYRTNIPRIISISCLAVKTTNNVLASKPNTSIVLVDFTSPDSSIRYIYNCCITKLCMVVGTTGFNRYQLSMVKRISRYIAISYSANFSIGIALMIKLLRILVPFLRDCIDIHIIEVHHRNKRDAPSGTALMIRNCITDLCIRPISFSSIRIGNTIGVHKISFADLNECISISHKAHNRMVFANGAIRTASWLLTKSKGLFSMLNVLEL